MFEEACSTHPKHKQHGRDNDEIKGDQKRPRRAALCDKSMENSKDVPHDGDADLSSCQFRDAALVAQRLTPANIAMTKSVMPIGTATIGMKSSERSTDINLMQVAQYMILLIGVCLGTWGVGRVQVGKERVA